MNRRSSVRHAQIERWLARRLALLMQGYMEGRLTLADFNRRLTIAWRACDRAHGCLANNTTGVEP